MRHDDLMRHHLRRSRWGTFWVMAAMFVPLLLWVIYVIVRLWRATC